MVHLRTFQSGRHSLFSQRLLNEVAAAKVVLLSPATKAAYDEQLQGAFPRHPKRPPASRPKTQRLTRTIHRPGRTSPAVCLSLTAAESVRRGPHRDFGPSRCRKAADKSRHNDRRRGGGARPCSWGWRFGSLLGGGQTAGRAALAEKQSGQPTVRQPIDRPGADARQAAGRSDNPPARSGPDTPIPPEGHAAAIVEPVATSPPIPAEGPNVAKAGPAAAMTRPIFEKPSETAGKARRSTREAGNAVLRLLARQARR